MKFKKSILLAIFCLGSLNSKAQSIFPNEQFAISGRAGLGYNMYSSNFSQFQGAIDCGVFESGSGFAPNFMLGTELPISDKAHIGLNLGLFDRSGVFEKDNFFKARNMISGSVETVNTINKIETNISYLQIAPEIRFVLIPQLINAPLRAMAAIRVEIPTSKNFRQYEEINTPSTAVFTNNNGTKSRSREIAEGEIKTLATTFGVSAGVENMLKLSETMHLTQQLVFDYNFNNQISDPGSTWSLMALRLDIGLRYSFTSEPEPVIIPIKEEKKEIIVEKKVEKAPVILKPELSIEISNKLEDAVILTGNEILATIPLVNSVFFPQNSKVIPAAYRTKAIENANYFSGDPVEKHYEMLPRIAEIVKQNPKASITVQGYTSGIANEAEGLDLANSRATAIKNILIHLGVAREKIEMKSSLEPAAKSNQDFKEGVEENQRVDIIVNNAPLQEYVGVQKFAELNASANIDLKMTNFAKDAQTTISSPLSEENIKAKETGSYKLPIKTRLDEKAEELTIKTIAKTLSLEENAEQDIDLEDIPRRQIELNLSNFEAILRFDYNSSKLSDDNKGLLSQLSQQLPEGATIVILGSTDALGTSESNTLLAKSRAEETSKYIQSLAANKFKFETGMSEEKFTENTPQGRFLNRCIRIRVKK